MAKQFFIYNNSKDAEKRSECKTKSQKSAFYYCLIYLVYSVDTGENLKFKCIQFLVLILSIFFFFTAIYLTDF